MNLLPAEMTGDLAENVAQLTEQAVAWLSQAVDIETVNEMRAKADALNTYLRQRDAGRDAEQRAVEIRLCAERRLGELLEIGREEGTVARRGDQTNVVAVDIGSTPSPDIAPKTLSDLGLSRDESAAFARLADIDDEQFVEVVADLREEGDLSRAAVLRSADEQLAQDRKEFAEHAAANPTPYRVRCPECQGCPRCGGTRWIEEGS